MYANMLCRKKSRLFTSSNRNSNNYSKVLNKTMARGRCRTAGVEQVTMVGERGRGVAYWTYDNDRGTAHVGMPMDFSHDPRSPGPMLPHLPPTPFSPYIPGPLVPIAVFLLLPEWHVNETPSK